MSRILWSLHALLLMVTLSGESAAVEPLGITTRSVVTGLSLPTAMCPIPGDNQRLLVIEQHTGKIRVILNGVLQSTALATVGGISTGNEQGLVGIVCHPDFATNGWIFINCTNSAGNTEIRRLHVPSGSSIADAYNATTDLVLAYNQPESNHNGGWLAFGPDGKLYIGAGDGGGSDDNHGTIGNAQDLSSPLGKILRYTVTGSGTLVPPSDNPYAGVAGKFGGIWVYGLRHPWRCSFDRSTGELWIGDVGQNNYEEIDRLAAGENNVNFGWRMREGTHPNANRTGDTNPGNLREPVLDYDRTAGSCVIGGHVYRGAAIPSLVGTYLFADYGGNKFYSWTAATNRVDRKSELVGSNSISPVVSIDADNLGELYLCDHGNGTLWQVMPSLQITTTTVPNALRDSAYSTQLVAIGAVGATTWTLTSGTLPSGITLSSSGLLSGTPTTVTSATFTVSVTDGSVTNARSLTLTVTAPQPLAITTTTLPAGRTAQAYRAVLAVSGGVPPLTWSLTSGTLPSGLTLGSDGVLSGIPATGGTLALTVRVVDSTSDQTSRALTLVLDDAPLITSTAPGEGGIGLAWSYPVIAVGKTPRTLTVVTGPAGMSVSGSTLTWTPTVAGTESVTIRVSNGVSPVAEQSFTITSAARGIPLRPPSPAYLGMPTDPASLPTLLSTTGTFSDTASLTPVAALIPYSLNLPFWSDHAVKTRWVAVPDNQTVGWSADGQWTFPTGTVFVKHFAIALDESQPTVLHRLETRILVQDAAGIHGASYRWNAAGTDATVVLAAATEMLSVTTSSGTRNQEWYYPSTTDCLACHSTNSGLVLGLNSRQLTRDMTYPSATEQQLAAWRFGKLFSAAPSDAAIAAVVRLSAIGAPGASLELQARSYLDVNCAPCHRPGGAPASFDARFTTALGSAGLLDGVVADPLGITGARVVAPGNPAASIMLVRALSADPSIRMPRIGRRTTDVPGTTMLRDWILSTGTAPTPTPTPVPPVVPVESNPVADDSKRGCGVGGVAALFLLVTGFGLMAFRTGRRP